MLHRGKWICRGANLELPRGKRATTVRLVTAASLVSLVVCGCGGSSNDEAVASNPPAPAPAPAPDPAPAPAPEPVPAPALSVDTSVLAAAICTSTQPIHGQPRVLAAVPGDPDKGLVTASQDCTADSVPVYYLSSGSYQRTPEIPYYPHLFLRVDLLSRTGPLELGSLLTVQTTESSSVSDYQLTSASTFLLPGQQSVESGRTLHEWRATTAGEPVARLRLEGWTPTADRPEPLFKVCWQVALPTINRITCSLHEVADGRFRGLEIVDDSAGTGPITWVGWF